MDRAAWSATVHRSQESDTTEVTSHTRTDGPRDCPAE